MVFCEKSKRSRILASYILAMMLIVPQANAAAVDNVTNDGEVSVLRCAENGEIEFELFMDSVLYKEKIFDLFEPLYDITVRNQCQSIDVAGLIRQQDKMRQQISTAFLTCNTETMAEMKKGYYELMVEIYYVRNVVKGGIVFSLPLQLIEKRLGDKAALTLKDDLYLGIKERFSDEFSEDELANLYLGLETKYANRVKDYLRCDSGGGFDQVAKKWKQFKEHFSEDYAGLGNSFKGIQGRALQLKQEVESIKTVEAFSGDKLSLEDYAKSWVQLNVNGVSPTKSTQEIVEEIQANLPDFNISSITHFEILNRLVHEEQTFDARLLEAEMRSNFDLLYGSGSESSELFADQLDGRDKPEVVGLLEILEDSVGMLSAIDDGLNDVNLRQCTE